MIPSTRPPRPVHLLGRLRPAERDLGFATTVDRAVGDLGDSALAGGAHAAVVRRPSTRWQSNPLQRNSDRSIASSPRGHAGPRTTSPALRRSGRAGPPSTPARRSLPHAERNHRRHRGDDRADVGSSGRRRRPGVQAFPTHQGSGFVVDRHRLQPRRREALLEGRRACAVGPWRSSIHRRAKASSRLGRCPAAIHHRA